MKNLQAMAQTQDIMSNFDKVADHTVTLLLQTYPGKAVARYPGWNFCSYVWHENGKFHCQVWVYNRPVEEISAVTPEEIMTLVSDKYGYD